MFPENPRICRTYNLTASHSDIVKRVLNVLSAQIMKIIEVKLFAN